MVGLTLPTSRAAWRVAPGLTPHDVSSELLTESWMSEVVRGGKQPPDGPIQKDHALGVRMKTNPLFRYVPSGIFTHSPPMGNNVRVRFVMRSHDRQTRSHPADVLADDVATGASDADDCRLPSPATPTPAPETPCASSAYR